MSEAPFDRAIALACTMPTLRGRWISVQCDCKHSTYHPVILMLREHADAERQTLADALVRIRCGGCGSRGVAIHLCETPHGVGPISGTVRRGWTILLHDGRDKPEPPALAAAAE